MKAEGHFRLGSLWQAKGRLDEARRQYEAAVAEDPRYLPAWLQLGALLVEMQCLDEAVDVYREARRFHPQAAVLGQRLERMWGRSSRPRAQRSPSGRGPKVLFYSDCAGRYGAGEINHAVACGLQAAGFRVTMAQSLEDDPRLDDREALGIAHRPLRPDSIYRPTERRALVDSTELEGLLQGDPPDVLLFADGCPFSNLAAREAAVARGLPTISVVHAVADEWAREFAATWPRLATVYAGQRQVVTVSQHSLAQLRTAFGLSEHKGVVILNSRPDCWFAGVNSQARTRFRTEFGVPEHALLLLTTASMETRKGYQHQLHALRLLAERRPHLALHLMWAGGGSLEPQLRAQAYHLPFHIHFLGERDDVSDLLDACDAVVLTSEFEGMPLAVLEAMARGRAVAATAVSGIPEALGPTGHLLPDPNRDPLCTAARLADVVLAWSDDPVRRRQTGLDGRQRALRLFRESRMVAEYVDLLSGFDRRDYKRRGA